MIYLMNSAVMPAGCYGTYRYTATTVEELRELLHGVYGPWQSRIGYPQTADIIGRWAGRRPTVDRTITELEDGDEMFIVRLRYRVPDPATKGAPVSNDPADWELAWVEYRGEGDASHRGIHD